MKHRMDTMMPILLDIQTKISSARAGTVLGQAEAVDSAGVAQPGLAGAEAAGEQRHPAMAKEDKAGNVDASEAEEEDMRQLMETSSAVRRVRSPAGGRRTKRRAAATSQPRRALSEEDDNEPLH